MILVVCLNPALDVTHHVAGADWSGVNRPHDVAVRAGGKGLNVARTLAALGGTGTDGTEVLVTGLAGGPAGEAVLAGLADAGVPAEFTSIAAETRRTFAVVDTARGQTALFNEPGPPVSAAEYDRFARNYRAALADSAAVVLSGSLPGGLPPETYAELAGLATAAGVPVVLDADGPPLRLGMAGHPSIIKPNLDELERSVNRPLRLGGLTGSGPDLPAVTKAARELMTAGADAAVVSLGADGLLAVTGSGTWLAAPPGPITGNPTGAGDAAVAGLARGLAVGQDWPERLRQAAALGSAAVAAPVAGEFSQDVYRELLPAIRVTQVDH